MAVTGLQLINDSLLELGVGALGEDTHQSILNHALRQVNSMLSTWSAELGPVYASVLDELTWTGGEQSQTIGTGGDLDTIRPIDITGFQVRVNGIDYTLRPVSFEQYQTTRLKDTSNNYPTVYAFQKTYPLGILYMYYEPSANASVRIQSKKPLSSITLAAQISFPDGYQEAIQKNLAIRLASAHGESASPELIRTAFQAKQAILNINEVHSEVFLDSNVPGVASSGYDSINETTIG